MLDFQSLCHLWNSEEKITNPAFIHFRPSNILDHKRNLSENSDFEKVPNLVFPNTSIMKKIFCGNVNAPAGQEVTTHGRRRASDTRSAICCFGRETLLASGVRRVSVDIQTRHDPHRLIVPRLVSMPPSRSFFHLSVPHQAT